MHYKNSCQNNSRNKFNYSVSDIFEDDDSDEVEDDNNWTITGNSKTIDNDMNNFQNFLWIHQGTLDAEDFQFF